MKFILTNDRLFFLFYNSRAIRNLFQLVLLHQQKDNQPQKTTVKETDSDFQLKKVQEFVNDLTKITNEITREGFAYYIPPSTTS